MTARTRRPYLSIVVATRNDDHGGDPLRRLQGFVNTFAAQCTRADLDVELIVVEWNPPPDRPRVGQLLRLPADALLTVRVVEVPASIHQTFRAAAALPLFQMIAKNVGIRRARGRFVLATNIDIICSNELVDHLGSRQLAPGHLYRVDRHDIDAAFPVDAGLEDQMEYCRTHHLRLHAQNGSHVVDPHGRSRFHQLDIAGSTAVTLGPGWHVREGDASSAFWRWTMREAHLSIDRTVGPDLTHGVVLEVDVEPNPYQSDAWVDLEIMDGARRLTQRRLTRRTRLQLGLEDDVARHDLVIRTNDSSDSREHLPLLERRDGLCCRVYEVSVRPARYHHYDVALWRRATNRNEQLQVQHTSAGVEVTTDGNSYSYCTQYAPFEAPADGTYEFALEYLLIDGHLALTVMDDTCDRWLPSSRLEAEGDGTHWCRVTVELQRGARVSLFVSNNRPNGGQSHFILRRLIGSVPSDRLIRSHQDAPIPAIRRANAYVHDAPAAITGAPRTQPPGDLQADVSDRIRELEAELKALTPLADLIPLARLLRDHRPTLHQNACGDFQLMAREHWFALRGYPEFEMFSMNIDGLFEAIAHAAGIREQVWDAPLCIYHLEHERGSGWTPEGEALLQSRIATSGVAWFDAGAAHILSTYMRWLRRPMIFNEATWGLGGVVLQETCCDRRSRETGPGGEDAMTPMRS